MFKKNILLLTSLLCSLFLLTGCFNDDKNEVSKKEKKVITESLENYFDYTGDFEIIHVSNQGYGLGSPVHRNVSLMLSDYDVEIGVYYLLNSFSKVTKETEAVPTLNTYVEDYLLEKELGVNSNEYSLYLSYDFDDVIKDKSLKPKEELDIILGKNESYTFDDYLNQISYYNEFEFNIYNDSDILETDTLIDFLEYIRENNNIEKFSFYIEDKNYMLELNSETDNKRKNIKEFLFKKGDFDKSDMSSIDSILNNNFTDYDILEEFTPLDFNRSDSVFYKVKDNITNEEFTVWTFNTFEIDENGTVTSYSAGTPGLSLYTDRFTNVVNRKLKSNSVGELKIHSDGYYVVQLNGFSEEELYANFENIRSNEIDNLGFTIILKDSIENTNTYLPIS